MHPDAGCAKSLDWRCWTIPFPGSSKNNIETLVSYCPIVFFEWLVAYLCIVPSYVQDFSRFRLHILQFDLCIYFAEVFCLNGSLTCFVRGTKNKASLNQQWSTHEASSLSLPANRSFWKPAPSQRCKVCKYRAKSKIEHHDFTKKKCFQWYKQSWSKQVTQASLRASVPLSLAWMTKKSTNATVWSIWKPKVLQ